MPEQTGDMGNQEGFQEEDEGSWRRLGGGCAGSGQAEDFKLWYRGSSLRLQNAQGEGPPRL